MAGVTGFRYTVWDPFMICAQMATLQCIYYVSLGLCVAAADLSIGQPRDLEHIFKFEAFGNSHGRLLIGAFIINALICSIALWHVVQRTKLCLDFTCTVHFFHVIACWAYNGHLAGSFSWWVINVVCVAVMCVSGEFLCMRTELKAIPVSMAASAAQKVDL